MADTKITAESVAAEADRLLATGEKVTSRAIIAALGGSFRDVGPHLTAWKAAREERQELAELDVPEDLATAASDLVARIWRGAMAAATAGHEAMRKRIAELTARLSEQAEEHAGELDDMAAELRRVDEERVGVLDDLVAAHEERDRVQAELDGAGIQIATLEARVEGLAAQLVEVRAERDGLRGERDAAHAETAAVRAAAEETSAKAVAEVDRLRGELGAAEGRVREVQEQVIRIGAERDGLKDKLVMVQDRATAAEARADAEAARLAGALDVERQARAEAGEAKAEVARLSERLAARVATLGLGDGNGKEGETGAAVATSSLKEGGKG